MCNLIKVKNHKFSSISPLFEVQESFLHAANEGSPYVIYATPFSNRAKTLSPPSSLLLGLLPSLFDNGIATTFRERHISDCTSLLQEEAYIDMAPL